MATEAGLPAILSAARRRWMVFLLLAVPLALGVGIYTFSAPSYYDADTTVAFAPRPDSQVGADIIQVILPRYVSLLKARVTTREVSQETGVDAQIVEGAEVSIVTDSANLMIVVRDTDPERAAAVANALAGRVLEASQSDDLLLAQQIATALPPSVPSGPPRALLMAVGLVAALAAGVAGAVVAEGGQPRVREDSDVAAVNKSLSVLGRIPKSRQLSGRNEGETLDPVVRAAARAVLARMDHASGTTGGHAAEPLTDWVLGITSPEAGDGKTTLALAYALAAARQGRRVVLVDADMSGSRNDRVSVKVPGDAVVDLSTILAGEVSIDECLRKSPLQGVVVVRAVEEPDAADALPRRLSELLESLVGHVEHVILDLPPVTDHDGQASLTQVSAVLLVVRCGESTAALSYAVSLLETMGAVVAGVVLNRCDRRGARIIPRSGAEPVVPQAVRVTEDHPYLDRAS